MNAPCEAFDPAEQSLVRVGELVILPFARATDAMLQDKIRPSLLLATGYESRAVFALEFDVFVSSSSAALGGGSLGGS